MLKKFGEQEALLQEAWVQKALAQEALVNEDWAEDTGKGKNWQVDKEGPPFIPLRVIHCQTLLSQPKIALFSDINCLEQSHIFNFNC